MSGFSESIDIGYQEVYNYNRILWDFPKFSI